jgi:RNA polymerase sigma factor (sigma-70 family)
LNVTEAEFNQQLKWLSGYAWRRARGCGADTDEALDCVSRARLAVLSAAQVWRGERPFGALARLCADRAVINWRREWWGRLRRLPTVPLETVEELAVAHDPAEEALRLIEREALWAAVGRLPQGEAEVLTLLYREGKSYAETAALLGCGETLVSTRRTQGLATLREAGL